MSRPELLERYAALPLPTTKDEHWRFTDLAGFDPDAWRANGANEIAAPATILELDASGVAHVGEAGIEIVSSPEGIRHGLVDRTGTDGVDLGCPPLTQDCSQGTGH